MPEILVSKAIDHIKHELGNVPSSEIDTTELVSNAYQVLTTMHRWRFLEMQSVSLPLEKNQKLIRLPVDFERPLSIEGDGDIVRHIEIVDLNRLHEARRWNATPNTGYHYAAVIHKVPTTQNALLQSEDFDQTGWAFLAGATGTVTPDVATNPLDGTLLSVDRILDTDAAGIAILEQTPLVHLTPSGDYYAEIILRPVDSSGVLAASPPKTFISLETPTPTDSGLKSLLEINWGAEPWRDAPTPYMLAASTTAAPTANTGLADVGAPVPLGEGFWKFPILHYAHSLGENYGRINFHIAPAAATFGSANGTSSAAETNKGVEVVRTQLAQGRLAVEYYKNTTSVFVPTVRRPFLDIHPEAVDDLVSPFTMYYVAGPVNFEATTETIPVPRYCEVLFFEVLRALASGWEDSDESSATVRLETVELSRTFKKAKIADGLTVPSLGVMRNGIGGHNIWQTGLASNIAGPKAAGT